MPELSIEFDVVCAVCSEPLRATVSRNNEVRVDPCPKCLSDSREAGVTSGHADGFAKGYEEGLYDCYNK